MKGLIFNIQRFCTRDGPGIRTTVFFKGCNVNCVWCHNPESIDGGPVLKFYGSRCVNCGRCAEACRYGATVMTREKREFFPLKCTLCGDCVMACRQKALEIAGREYTAGEVVSLLLKDEDYYMDSGGGVTFSGGEPLLQADFLTTILKELKNKGIHTAVDTALHVEWKTVEKILPWTDLILLDLKGMNSVKHFNNTGIHPSLIQRNAEKLSDTEVDIIVRLPLVRELNDELEEIQAAAVFIKGWKHLLGVEFLPYHSMGADKSGFFPGLKPQKVYEPPLPEFLTQAKEIFSKYKIRVL